MKKNRMSLDEMAKTAVYPELFEEAVKYADKNYKNLNIYREQVYEFYVSCVNSTYNTLVHVKYQNQPEKIRYYNDNNK